MKKCIIIPAYNGFERDLPLGIESWKKYANKFNIDIFVLNDILEETNGISSWENGAWSKWKGVANVINNYDKFLLVDADTMIRWDTEDIFEITKDYSFCVVKDAGGANTGAYHFNQWVQLTKEFKPSFHDYFNTGVILFDNKNGKIIIDNMPKYFEFWKNRNINNIRIDAVEQTAVNIVAQEYFHNEIVFLEDIFNNMVMCKYEDLSFINDSYIWHFTGPLMGGWGVKDKIMEQTWDVIKEYY